jgi:hypothetical protein
VQGVKIIMVKLLWFSKDWSCGGDRISNNDNDNNKDHVGKVVIIIVLESRIKIVKQYHQ